MSTEIKRSFDPSVMRKACKDFNGENFDYDKWLANRLNIMYVSPSDAGDNVGLATFEYPGVYNAHWFFSARGKEALDIAFKMYDELFKDTEAEAVRGLTPINLRGARYLAKQIGFETVGVEEFNDGFYDHMVLTRPEFLKRSELRSQGKI